ncbi:AAA family ATPase [Verrucomicrobiaceae bacterium R5-34]|nr:AAA family ATPase [Verrucomicrobiaceae bacterium R5-34]
MYDLAIRAKNYKCFREETGFDSFSRVNLIIGRNNAGKSSLLDLIEIVVTKNYGFAESTWRDNECPHIIFEAAIPDGVVHQVFPSNTSGGSIGGNHMEYGKQLIGRVLKWSKSGSDPRHMHLVDCDDSGITPSFRDSGDYVRALLQKMPIPLEGKIFRRLLAERDILPEKSDTQNITIGNNGGGLTNVIQNFINKSTLPSDLVEVTILEALNSIFAHDAVFTDIVCQLHEDNNWEIYLEEEFKGRVALSQSGSGLKTVMSVLACLILVPYLEGQPLSEYIFGFEELENNIHPALLRRLNDYIYRYSLKHEFCYVITTHSNVLIDQFSKQGDAQIIHVKHVDSVATCNAVKTYIENNGILDDLDVRASDLLQANGVIWVEGPSDRIYLNRWISLWSDGELNEGSHYQIIFYGGRLLSHLNAEAPDDVESGISILNTNRNAIMLIDSDKRARQTPINATKERIRVEFVTMEAHCWVTKGREIENYIPAAVVDAFCDVQDSRQVERYESFFEYLDTIVDGEGSKYNGKKPLLAEKLSPMMTKENLKEVLDINVNMIKVCDAIRSWNS